MISNKHDAIAQSLEERIDSGEYSKLIPKALDLAEEFGVNFKTVNKAIKQLVDKGVLYRKPGIGTFIAENNKKVEDTLIEVLFVGSAEVSSHPYYNDMWQGILKGLDGSGYKVVLTMLKEDPQKGGLADTYDDFTPTAAKMLIGTNNIKQVDKIKKQKVPFVLVGSKSARPDVTCVYASASEAITNAVDYLKNKGLNDIAYLGITHDDGEHLNDLEKFHAYISAVQKDGNLNSELIKYTPPLADYAAKNMKEILKYTTPQAVMVAYDHLVPEVYRVIEEAGHKIPDDISVIGIDNLGINVTPKLTSIDIDRHKIGYSAAHALLNILNNSEQQPTTLIEAEFDPTNGESTI